MCCIFTCCGWMIDFLQRLWTFAMSCLISSAVCCSLMFASMAGIALGYNYSLAEYIDLQESNVSVYLKHGVFDDEVKDDVSWRGADHMPVAGHLADRNLITASPEEESTPLQSGRRLDDLIFESYDANKYEGDLLKLTTKAPDPTTTTKGYTSDLEMAEIARKYPYASLNQLKEIHNLVNKKKSSAPLQVTDGMRKQNYPQFDEKYLSNHATYLSPDSMRLMNTREPNLLSSSLRKTVPSEYIGLKTNWLLKHPEALPPDLFGVVTPRPDIVKLTRPEPETKLVQQTPVRTKPTTPLKQETIPPPSKLIDEEMDSHKEKLLLNKLDSNELKGDDYLKKNRGKEYDADDYEDEIKGLPVRRKRQVIEEVKIINSNKLKEISTEISDVYTETNLVQTLLRFIIL